MNISAIFAENYPYFLLLHILASPIEYLKGVGPQRADSLKKELNIFTFGDLLEHFPFRHVDKTKINFISDINSANGICTGCRCVVEYGSNWETKSQKDW